MTAHIQKVMDEGDTPGIGAETHSFYWKKAGFQSHDYEPRAILSSEKMGLARYHYRGLVIWKGYVKKGKPTVPFGKIWHAPLLWSSVTYSKPSDIVDHLKLIGYLLPKIQQMRKNTERCLGLGHVEKIAGDRVPPVRKLRWDDFDYYVLVAPFQDYGRPPAKISDEIGKFVV